MATQTFLPSHDDLQADGQETEIWVVCPRYPNYEVSSLGRVRRCKAGRTTRIGRILRPSKNYTGYWHICLYQDGRMYTVRMNRLVCEAFHGPAPSKEHVSAHNNSNADDNSKNNLRWATRIENENDKTRAGRRPPSPQGRSPLSAEAVIAIRKNHNSLSAASLARHYGVNVSTIHNIKYRKTWKHLP